MKLGDSMAPIEAHSVWNDVCPQKTRPPKIGDIPRHVAVDKESPSCSSSRSLGQYLEQKPAKSMLERSTSCQACEGRSKLTEALPLIHDLIKSSSTTNSNKNSLQISDKTGGKLEIVENSSKIFFDDSGVMSSLPILSEICSKNFGTEVQILNKNPSLRVSESVEENDEHEIRWENEEKIYQIRKDSALYIDERNLESLTFSENFLASGGPESRPLKTPGSSSPSENCGEEFANLKLSKPRARRESSGYFSNLGTFDEDRWISTIEIPNQQDLIASRDFSRERPNSSTKNRLPPIFQSQQPLQPPGPSCGQQSLTKLPPNLLYHIETNFQSSPNEFTTAPSPKSSRNEMPDIEEQISLEIDKSSNFDSSNYCNDVVLISSHKNDDLEQKMSQISINNGSGSRDDLPSPIGIEEIDKSSNFDSSNYCNDVVLISSHKNDDLEQKMSQISINNCSGSRNDLPSPIGIEEIDKSSNFDSSNYCNDVVSISGHKNDDLEQKMSQISINNGSGSRNDLPSPIGIEEIDKSSKFDSSNYCNDVVSISGHKNDDLEQKMSQISINNGSGSRNDLPSPIGIEEEENIEESSDPTENVFSAEDKSVPWISGACSQPGMTLNLEDRRKIVESNGPAEIGEKNDFFQYSENNASLRDCCAFDEAIVDEDDDDQVVEAVLEPRKERNLSIDPRKSLPKPIKVYQLLSTQSEDRGDDEARIFDRRISLQITRPNEDETIRENSKICLTKEQRNRVTLGEDKKLIHADSVPIFKISTSSDLAEDKIQPRDLEIDPTRTSRPPEMFSTSGTSGISTDERLSLLDKPSASTIPAVRPIYPYCPYSPYGSPQGSPRTNRKRPLRESRRVSIDSRQGALQLNQYKLLNNIGQGSYGIVKLAYNEEDDTHYAMKILSKKKLMKKAGIFGRIAPGRKSSSNPLAKVYREIALLKKLDHPNVVKLVEVLDDPDEDNLYLVFELVQKGEVLQIPTDKPLDEETARRYFRDVVMGVEYLHYQRIVHRDIKPSNLLVDSEGRVKVADLGVSAELRASGELLSGSAGTPAFAAPETSTPGAEYSGTLCDVWSMGVTLYCLVTGKVPWDGSGSIIGVQAAIRSEQLRFPEKPRLSDSLYDLLSRMLAKDPAKRIDLADIKEHCWLTNNGSEALPSETENCRLPVTVTDEEVARVVTRVPKLDTLILIKTMLKQHSFQNPFLPRRTPRTGLDSVADAAMKKHTSNNLAESPKNFRGQNLATKTEKFHNDGRSNSAPDRYEWHTNGRQMSSDSLLAPVREASSQETEMEKR